VQVGDPVVTDAAGTFAIAPAPVGVFKLMADGTTATLGGQQFPTLEYDIVTVAGQENTVGMPIYLPALDPNARVCVSPTTGGVLTIASSPGFSLTIAAGSATFPGGSKTGCVSVTPVNPDKVPMAPGFGQQPRYIVTIQPVGTVFNPPAPMTIPNMDGLAPRTKTEMYSYDHDLAAFVAIGSGTVSADGSVIASDPGIGVIKAGWHCGGNPSTSGSAGTCPECQKCQGSNCVADNGQTPAQSSPVDCKKEVCSGGSKVSQANDSEQPPQNSPTDCKKEVCSGGAVTPQNDDTEVPTEICKECKSGTPANRPNGKIASDPNKCCFDGVDLPKYNNAFAVLIAKCPSREQVTESIRQHEIDGCSNSPDDLESWDNLPFATNYNLYVVNPIWGTVLGRISNAVAATQTLPCNVHDICYQTCRNNKGACDTVLGAGITTSCDVGYPFPCPHATQAQCAEYDAERQSCREIGPWYVSGVQSSAGTNAYQDRQSQFCACCGS